MKMGLAVKNPFFSFLFTLSVVALPCCCDVVVMDWNFNKTIDMMADDPSDFGPVLSSDGFRGLLHLAHPNGACGTIGPPPFIPDSVPPAYRQWIALIHRDNCTYARKVINAQAAGYSAVIVMNIGSDDIRPMSASAADAANVTIPSVFVGQTDGVTLNMFFTKYHRFGIILTDDLPFNIQSYLLPFATTVAVCFLGMLICMIIKCIRDYRRSMRHRLSWRALRRLPLHKFKASEDTYELCAICLDDYVDGDKLRILPCNHAYHSRCIDPWLTKRRRVCPVCKQKVRVGSDPADDSDDDSDNERSTSETAPLLHQATQVSSGTFAVVRENPFQRAGRQQRSQAAAADGGTSSGDSDGAGADGGDEEAVSRVQDTPGEQIDDVSRISSAAMLPMEGEEIPDELDVVTVTRSVRKKKKKNKKSKAAASGGSDDGAGSHTVVEVGHDNHGATDSGDCLESDQHSTADPVV